MPTLGKIHDFRERYFVRHIESHDVGCQVNEDQFEREWVVEHRWWAIEEIQASDDIFAPGNLAELLAQSCGVSTLMSLLKWES